MKRAFCLCVLLVIGCATQPQASSYDARIEAERQAQENYRQAYVQDHPELSEEQKTAILGKRTWIGMTAEQCEASLGKPYTVHVTQTADSRLEQWVYRLCVNGPCVPQALYRNARCAYLYFENGKLTTWQN